MGDKCIAIGNTIRGDDGIGIKIAEELTPQLSKAQVEVIICETDSLYALSKIKEGDRIFILDATYLNIPSGSITIIPIEEIIHQKEMLSQHQFTIFDALKIANINVKGYLIGIEIGQIEFSTTLSPELSKKFKAVCNKIYEFINKNRSYT